MSDVKEEVRQALNSRIKQYIEASTLRPSKVCKVKYVSTPPSESISDSLFICDCEPLDGTSMLEDVKLTAGDGVGMVLIPKIDSYVNVTFKSDSDAFVSMVSEVDFIFMNGNNFGGLVKVSELVSRLNTLESKVNSLIASIAAWSPISGDGGAALKASLATWIGTNITLTQISDLESAYVKHGDGNLI